MAGVPVILIGEGVRIWSSGYLNKDRVLVQDGPYALIRHPLYLGNLLIGLGFALMTHSWLLVVFFLLAYGTIYSATIVEEEKGLGNRFGEAYTGYVRRVSRFLPRRGKAAGRRRFRWRRVVMRREHRSWMTIGGMFAVMILRYYWVVS